MTIRGRVDESTGGTTFIYHTSELSEMNKVVLPTVGVEDRARPGYAGSRVDLLPSSPFPFSVPPLHAR